MVCRSRGFVAREVSHSYRSLHLSPQSCGRTFQIFGPDYLEMLTFTTKGDEVKVLQEEEMMEQCNAGH